MSYPTVIVGLLVCDYGDITLPGLIGGLTAYACRFLGDPLVCILTFIEFLESSTLLTYCDIGIFTMS